MTRVKVDGIVRLEMALLSMEGWTERRITAIDRVLFHRADCARERGAFHFVIPSNQWPTRVRIQQRAPLRWAFRGLHEVSVGVEGDFRGGKAQPTGAQTQACWMLGLLLQQRFGRVLGFSVHSAYEGRGKPAGSGNRHQT